MAPLGGFLWKFAAFPGLLLLFNLLSVDGYYCEFGQCGNDEYCCGKNLCCTYVYKMWYPWVGVMFVLLLMLACAGLFRYCCNQTSVIIIPNSMARRVTVPVRTDVSDAELLQPLTQNEETDASYCEVNLNFYSPQQRPPLYDEAVASDFGKRTGMAGGKFGNLV